MLLQSIVILATAVVLCYGQVLVPPNPGLSPLAVPQVARPVLPPPSYVGNGNSQLGDVLSSAADFVVQKFEKNPSELSDEETKQLDQALETLQGNLKFINEVVNKRSE